MPQTCGLSAPCYSVRQAAFPRFMCGHATDRAVVSFQRSCVAFRCGCRTPRASRREGKTICCLEASLRCHSATQPKLSLARSRTSCVCVWVLWSLSCCVWVCARLARHASRSYGLRACMQSIEEPVSCTGQVPRTPAAPQMSRAVGPRVGRVQCVLRGCVSDPHLTQLCVAPQRMLRANPLDRISPQDALRHPFFSVT